MFITFTGNPRDPRDTNGQVVYEGITFQLNREMEVEETPAFAKLRKNDHFSVRDGGASAPEPDEKADLVAFAEAHNIKINKRWTAERIQAEIDKALAEADKPGDDD